METIEALTTSGSGSLITATSIASVATVYALSRQTVVEQGQPVTFDAGDPRATAAQLESQVAGSAYVPFSRVNEHTRLLLSMVGATDGGGGRQGAEDLYLVLRGEDPNLGQYVQLVDAGRATYTFGAEQLGASGLYLPVDAAIDTSEALLALTGGIADLMKYPKTGYGRTGTGRPAMVSIFDKGPAIGVLRVMSRVGSSGITGVVGRHLRWR